MYIVLESTGEFEVFMFSGLWFNESCSEQQADVIKQELSKLRGDKVVEAGEKLLLENGFKKVSHTRVRLYKD